MRKSMYAGLEKVDPGELQAQRALTEALWSELTRNGIRRGSTGRIDAFLFADEEKSAAALTRAFGPASKGLRHH